MWANRVWYHDSACSQTGRMGIAVVAGKHLIAERIVFDEIAIHVLDIEPNQGLGGGTDIAEFRDNIVGSYDHSDRYHGYFFAAGGSRRKAFIGRVAVLRNIVTARNHRNSRVTGEGADTRTRRGFDFFNDNIGAVAADGPVLTLNTVDDVIVSGNIQPLRTSPFLDITDCTDVVIDGKVVA